MVDAGERVSITVRREFEEEAAITDDDQRALFRITEDLFARGQVVCRGSSTTPQHGPCGGDPTLRPLHRELGAATKAAGDDAAKVHG